MAHAAPTDPETGAVPTRISILGTTSPEIDPRQTTEYPSDLQDLDRRPSLWTGTGEVDVRSKEQDWTSTHTRQTSEGLAASEGFQHDEGPYMRVESPEKPSAARPSGLEMKTYTLSLLYASPPAQHEHSPAYGPFDQDIRRLKRPNLTRCQSWSDTQPSYLSSASGDRPQPRRWSMCTSDGGELQYPAGGIGTRAPALDTATVGRWCEEFHETRVACWQETVADFGQMWKRWCFAQRQARAWQDSLVKEATKDFWQPLSDFNYVLSVYSFLEGVRNRNLLPHLRRTYMAWRSPQQARFHEGCGLRDEEDGSSHKDTSSDDVSRDDESRTMASKYPLTIPQHLGVARICDDVEGRLKSLRNWLDEFQNRRQACLRMSKDAGLSNAAMAERRGNLTDAAREFSSRAKTLINQLRDSRTRLCEALGLDPKQVPGGDTASVPTMTAMKYERAPDNSSPCRGGLGLRRRFWLKKASLQASRIALKANLYITVMPRKIALRLLERMTARTTEMATMAREAGDYRAEAMMRRLHNKIRKVSERARQEFPDVKPKMTLLDSETWPSVLNTREDMQVEVHGHISTPVETLIDMLLSAQPGGNQSGNGERPSANTTTTTSENPPSEQASGDCQPLTTSSSTMSVPEAEADKT